MKNIIYLHITTINNYQQITDEIINSIIDSDLINNIEQLSVVILGVKPVILPNHEKIKIIFKSPNLDLYEFATLNKLKEFSINTNENYNILYLHLKGLTSNNTNECINDWRRYMIWFNIYKWKDCLEKLETYDTCGVDLRNKPILHYSGNFWWSKTDYIKRLPNFEDLPIIISERHKAEFWLCSLKTDNYSSLWDCGIDVYERHLYRYEKNKYKK